MSYNQLQVHIGENN